MATNCQRSHSEIGPKIVEIGLHILCHMVLVELLTIL